MYRKVNYLYFHIFMPLIYVLTFLNMPILLILNIKIFSMAVERPDLSKWIILGDSVIINQDT